MSMLIARILTHCVRACQALDEALGELAEDVVVRHAAPAFGLDPFRPQAVPPAPFREQVAPPDHVQERPVHGKAATVPGAVIVVEIAVYRDPAGFGESDRLLDLAALEVALLQSRHPGQPRAEGQTGL